jgi:hypothetical protein
MLLQALDYAQSVGMDHVTVVECKMVEEYRVAREDDDNEDMEGKLSWKCRARKLSPPAGGNVQGE